MSENARYRHLGLDNRYGALIFDPVRLKQKQKDRLYKSSKVALYGVSAFALLGCIWCITPRWIRKLGI